MLSDEEQNARGLSILLSSGYMRGEPVARAATFGAFDGVDDYVEFPSIDLGSQFSVFVWLESSGGTETILADRGPAGGGVGPQLNFLETAGKLTLWVANKEIQATNVTPAGLHHVGFTFDSVTDRVRFYVDGLETSNHFNDGTPANNANPLLLFAQTLNGSTFLSHRTGQAADLRVYSDVITASEAGYLAGIGGDNPGTANLELFADFSAGSGVVVSDKSGNARHGQAKGPVVESSFWNPYTG